LTTLLRTMAGERKLDFELYLRWPNEAKSTFSQPCDQQSELVH
jgi:hypothetical protein